MICNLCPPPVRGPAHRDGRGGLVPDAGPASGRPGGPPPLGGTPISGKRGSGTVFFSGCSLGCVFCQNEAISHRDFGKALTVPRLREICLELIRQGAHNINFVNPTHYAHIVRQVLEEPLPVPGGVEHRGL